MHSFLLLICLMSTKFSSLARNPKRVEESLAPPTKLSNPYHGLRGLSTCIIPILWSLSPTADFIIPYRRRDSKSGERNFYSRPDWATKRSRELASLSPHCHPPLPPPPPPPALLLPLLLSILLLLHFLSETVESEILPYLGDNKITCNFFMTAGCRHNT